MITCSLRRRLRTFAAAALCVLFLTAGVDAQLLRSTAKTGTTAAQFLKIGVGGRAIAMGGATAAMTGDMSSLYWNPAAVSRLDVNGGVFFNHAAWLADINYDYAAGLLQLGTLGTFGITITSMRVPEDIVRTVDYPDGDGRRWDASAFALGISYAKNLTDRFSVGFTMKYLRDAIWSESANGIAFDIGTLYLSEIKGLRIGASISNFGSKMKLEGRDLSFNSDPNDDAGSGPNNIPSQYAAEEFDLPLSFRVGLAMDVFQSDLLRCTAALDAVHPNDNTEYINSGLEVGWQEMIYGRVGYKNAFMRDAEGGLTWGVGLRYGIMGSTAIRLDYAFADYGRLKNVQYFTVGLQF